MSFFDTIFPNHTCLACKAEINKSGNPYICDACAESLSKLKNIFGAQAPFVYKTPVKELILRFKYNSEGDIAKLFAPFMADRLTELAAEKTEDNEIDFIIPVPLSKERLKSRGYNQALVLANEIFKIVGLPVKEALVRVKKTEAQKDMTLKQRQQNLAGAFRAINKKVLKNKSVLLVDDVYTTGTTAEECIKALEKAGVRKVQILTIARVA